MTRVHDALRSLAEAFGLEVEYTDNWGRVHRADLKAIRSLLAAKGIVARPDLLTPGSQILVAPVDALPHEHTFSFRLEHDKSDSPVQPETIVIVAEDEQGGELSFSFGREEIACRPDLYTESVVASVPFPRDLGVGIYRVRVETSLHGRIAVSTATWIIAPAKSYLPTELAGDRRIAGIGIALYGVRSRENWGIGDFSDLKKVIAWAKDDLGVDFVGLNPLHALFNRRPSHISPYLPSSRLFRNFIYLDVPGIPEFQESSAAISDLRRQETQRLIQRLREHPHVAYDEVAALKLRILRKVFQTFLRNHRPPGKGARRWSEFESYKASRDPYLTRYATFCALEEHFRSCDHSAHTWREWPQEFRDPSSAAVRNFERGNHDAILFWMYLQWQIEEQLRGVQEYAVNKGMLVGLYHDEALSIDRNGADFWALQDFFHDEFAIGAPPDAFSPNGQDWGVAPPDRDKLRDSGYRAFRENLRANCQYGGALRIDHVMQLSRLFWVPVGSKPVEGFYVKDHESDLLNVLCLESRRNQTIIVGEDLGTIPPDFRERLMARGIFSYRLFYFERDSAGNLLRSDAYPEQALVSINTHDLPTLAGFWAGRDIELRLGIGQIDDETASRFREERDRHKQHIVERLVQEGLLSPDRAEATKEAFLPSEELHSAVLKFVFRTPSKFVQINQEDIFLDERQQNIPGTIKEHENWVTKMLYTVEDLTTHPEAIRLSQKFRRLLQESGRLVS